MSLLAALPLFSAPTFIFIWRILICSQFDITFHFLMGPAWNRDVHRPPLSYLAQSGGSFQSSSALIKWEFSHSALKSFISKLFIHVEVSQDQMNSLVNYSTALLWTWMFFMALYAPTRRWQPAAIHRVRGKETQYRFINSIRIPPTTNRSVFVHGLQCLTENVIARFFGASV